MSLLLLLSRDLSQSVSFASQQISECIRSTQGLQYILLRPPDATTFLSHKKWRFPSLSTWEVYHMVWSRRMFEEGGWWLVLLHSGLTGSSKRFVVYNSSGDTTRWEAKIFFKSQKPDPFVLREIVVADHRSIEEHDEEYDNLCCCNMRRRNRRRCKKKRFF